jgi:hypothetical protein
MIPNLNIRNTLTNRLDDTGALVSENNGESTLGIFSGERVSIGMANPRIINLNPDFMRPRRSDLYILDAEVLAGFPGNCCLYRVSTHPSFSLLGCVVRLSAGVCGSACDAKPHVIASKLEIHALSIYVSVGGGRVRTLQVIVYTMLAHILSFSMRCCPHLLCSERTYLSHGICGHDCCAVNSMGILGVVFIFSSSIKQALKIEETRGGKQES